MTEKVKHHPIMKNFKPWEGNCPKDFFVNFLGVFTREEYYGIRKDLELDISKEYTGNPPDQTSEENFISTQYPEFNHGYIEYVSLLESVLKAKDKFMMIELGAGIGQQVIQASAAIRAYHGPDFPYKCIAVEGEPTAYMWMQNHFKDNNVDPAQHELINAVVSDQDGSVLFEVGFPGGFGSFVVSPFRFITNPFRSLSRFIKRIFKKLKGQKLVKTDYWTGSKGLGIYTKKCKSVSLNFLLRDLKSVDFLHIDVFEQELKILKPAIEQLTNKVKKIHIETHTAKAEDELRKLFNSRGWKCVNDLPMGGVRKTEYGSFDFPDGVQTWINSSLEGSV